MGVGGLGLVGHLDVVGLRTADDLLLLLRRQGMPGSHVVEILLHHDVTAARERGVLIADEHGRACRVTRRVLAAVDEPEQVPVVEVVEAVHLVDDGRGVAELSDDVAGQLETEVHAPCPQMEEQIPRSGDGPMPIAVQLTKGMQSDRPRPAEQPVPDNRSDTDGARQERVGRTERDRTQQPVQPTELVAYAGSAPGAVVTTRKRAAVEYGAKTGCVCVTGSPAGVQCSRLTSVTLSRAHLSRTVSR